jgi:hypothetical protein
MLLIYPLDIARNDDDRPVIVFRNKVTAAENDLHIVFPMPASIQFGDSANFNPTEIGFGGGLIMNAAKSTGGDVNDALLSTAGSVAAAIPRDFQSLAGLLARSGKFGSGVQSAISVATGTVMNKNLVTEFSGMGTRQFSFTFKLISKSEEETKVIRNIVDAFREGLYPEGNALQLRYPPTWYINFQKGGEDIPWIPKTFELYLVSVNTTYNGTSNVFHADGSPVEIDLNVSFMESRALTKQDIEKLKTQAFRDGDFRYVFNDTREIAEQIAARVTKQKDDEPS